MLCNRNKVELMGRYSNPDNVPRLQRFSLINGATGRPIDPSHRSARNRRRLTDSQGSEVVRRYEAGESAGALAVEFVVDRRTLAGRLRRAGVEVRHHVVDRVDLDEAAQLYRSGRSRRSGGGALGCQ